MGRRTLLLDAPLVGEVGGEGNFGRHLELVVELLVDLKRLGVDTLDECADPGTGICPTGDVLDGGREGTDGVCPLGGVWGGGEFSLDDLR